MLGLDSGIRPLQNVILVDLAKQLQPSKENRVISATSRSSEKPVRKKERESKTYAKARGGGFYTKGVMAHQLPNNGQNKFFVPIRDICASNAHERQPELFAGLNNVIIVLDSEYFVVHLWGYFLEIDGARLDVIYD